MRVVGHYARIASAERRAASGSVSRGKSRCGPVCAAFAENSFNERGSDGDDAVERFRRQVTDLETLITLRWPG